MTDQRQISVEERIAELERRVRDLEARPVYVPVPLYPTLPPYQPIGPLPYRATWESPWVVNCYGENGCKQFDAAIDAFLAAREIQE